MSDLRVALCHEWTTTYGGSEQVAARLARILPVTDVYTFAARPELAAELFPGRSVRVHRTGAGRLGRERWPWLLPLMPRAWASLDLSGYDAVVTSSHACVNAIRPPPGVPVISYCHTPMRYAWEWRSEIGRVPAPMRPGWPAVAASLRRADREWSRHVTRYVANSHHVAARIWRNYGRKADVVHPPVDTGFFAPDASVGRSSFFLHAGRLVAYKRPDAAVDAALEAGAELVVAGDGPELASLRRRGGRRVRFVRNPTREQLRHLYRRARALVAPGVEDFGMTMVEAQACGTPVIAVAAGGAREAVRDGVTGVLHREGVPALADAMKSFDPAAYDPAAIRSHAETFGFEIFDREMREIFERSLDRG